MTEVVYENATKVDKRVTYQLKHGGPRTAVVKAGEYLRIDRDSKFKILKTETVE